MDRIIINININIILIAELRSLQFDFLGIFCHGTLTVNTFKI